MIPWFERPVIYDVRARPHLVESISGSRDLQMVNRLQIYVIFLFPLCLSWRNGKSNINMLCELLDYIYMHIFAFFFFYDLLISLDTTVIEFCFEYRLTFSW